MQRASALILGLVVILSHSCWVLSAEIEFYELDSLEGTDPVGVVAATTTFRGKSGIHLEMIEGHKCVFTRNNCTFLNLDTQEFHNGIIEVELAGKPIKHGPPNSRGFVGLVFRVNADYSNFEGIYLRPTNSTANNQIRRNHTTQYFSYPEYPWYRLRKEEPKKYESWADIVVGEWITMRIEVKDSSAKLYLNNNNNPVLVVNDLKLGPDAKGTIGLVTEDGSDAYFRNLRIIHY